MSLFYKTNQRTTNNSLLLFVTFSARFGTFREHVSFWQAPLIAVFMPCQALAAIPNTFIGYMNPTGAPIISLWIFQYQLVENKVLHHPMRQPNIADADNFKVHRLTGAMAACILTAQEAVEPQAAKATARHNRHSKMPPHRFHHRTT